MTMTTTEEKLLDLLVKPWLGGGYMVTLPWRKEGYSGGIMSIDMSYYWFAERESAVAAVMTVAGLNGDGS